MSIQATPSLSPAPSFPSGTPADVPAGRQRVVLDTNVCLDLFVFRDPRWAALQSALEQGTVEAYTREDCRSEWLAVLDYPHLPVTAETKPAICAEFDRLLRCLPLAQVNTFGLPICTDRDDQKFLELALQCQAHVLVSKDKAVLKLGKRTVKRGLFAIVPPQLWRADAFLDAAT
ncbi:putative toxin-antitoxin system toxin component, PIN family [Herbaspirillum sp. WGmk3]|uniref:Toxin-antitoxin system toxin component, PIN family n=1 Tax=Herbaspirillum huttiense subsp. lycopersici TaxID=3074428 RepID=A0ABU2EJ52_9BURK|nr:MULTISPECIES: putative toxin-antitoxin system toxin component, PIN family [Herbaspirillum]MCO4855008.1 putative toxin-antitoxin system toxin component, PIN family [Herbaspirillum sp. WGmk3]MDR9848174.1 putative toxin-antitoxin system toxin component, PIN family [Herbaspirillum huttiense SE1]